MSQRLNSKGLQTKITDCYRLADREGKGGEATSKETRTAANTDKPAPVAHRTSNMAAGFHDVKVP